MVFNDLSHDRQTDAAASLSRISGSIGAVEPVKDIRQILHRDSFTVVLSDSEKSLIGVKEDSDIRSLVIARVPEDYKQTTVNMKSPIIINTRNNKAEQVILPLDYPFRLPIYEQEVV